MSPNKREVKVTEWKKMLVGLKREVREGLKKQRGTGSRKPEKAGGTVMFIAKNY